MSVRFDHIFFDLDGVLIDSEPLWSEVDDGMLRAWGHAFDEATKSLVMGRKVGAASRLMIDRFGLPVGEAEFTTARVKRLVELVLSRPLLDDDADRTVRELAAGHTLHLVTGSTRTIVSAVFERFGWGPLFSTVTTSDEVDRGKPDPGIYLLALEKAGARRERSVVVEDSLNGVRAAVGAGLTPVVFDRPGSDAAAEAWGFVTIRRLSELLELDRLFSVRTQG